MVLYLFIKLKSASFVIKKERLAYESILYPSPVSYRKISLFFRNNNQFRRKFSLLPGPRCDSVDEVGGISFCVTQNIIDILEDVGATDLKTIRR